MDPVSTSAELFISGVRTDTALTLAAFCILYYDYALTVVAEIEYYWSPPSLSLSFVLFAVSRYVGLLGPIPVFFEYFEVFSQYRCRQFQMYHQVYAVLSQAIVAVLLILRTYALYNCSKRMLAVLIGMYMGGAIQSLTAILTSKSPLNTHFPLGFKYSGCDLSLTDDQGFHLALAWSAMLWFDTIIFVLTFYKAIKLRHEMPGGLLVTMFRDDFSDMFRYVQIREMMQSDPSDAQSSDIRFGPFRHSRIRHSSLDNFPPAERITTKLPHSKPENSGIGPGQDPTIIQLYRRILKPATDENRTVATGTVYYAILVAVNMANITTFLAISSKIPLKGTATTLTNVLSVTLTSRLMLNLRDPSVQIRRRVDGTRYEGWSVGQFSSRMMSFRPPTTMHTDNYTMNDMRESAATSSSVTV